MKNLLITLLVSLNLISCTTTKCSPKENRGGFSQRDPEDIPILQAVDSFVKIDIYAKGSRGTAKFASASGFFVSDKLVVTAKHACDTSDQLESLFGPEGGEMFSFFSGQTVKGKVFSLIPIKYHPAYDLCLMAVFGETGDIKILPISLSPPKVGEKAYNVAAPLGIFTTGMVPMFEGRYFGDTFCESEVVKCSVYGIPIRQGSSGSPIVNRQGYLIGVVFAGTSRFEHIAFSLTHKQLIEFLVDGDGISLFTEEQRQGKQEKQSDAGVSEEDAGDAGEESDAGVSEEDAGQSDAG